MIGFFIKFFAKLTILAFFSAANLPHCYLVPKWFLFLNEMVFTPPF